MKGSDRRLLIDSSTADEPHAARFQRSCSTSVRHRRLALSDERWKPARVTNCQTKPSFCRLFWTGQKPKTGRFGEKSKAAVPYGAAAPRNGASASI